MCYHSLHRLGLGGLRQGRGCCYAIWNGVRKVAQAQLCGRYMQKLEERTNRTVLSCCKHYCVTGYRRREGAVSQPAPRGSKWYRVGNALSHVRRMPVRRWGRRKMLQAL